MPPAPVPFLDLYAGNRRIETAFLRDLKALYRSSAFIGGPAVAQFERDFADALHARHCVAVSSGTAALHLSLMAHGVGPGDDVIVPAFTFPGAVGPVLHCGARPVFADVRAEDGCLDPESVARVLTKRTRALLVTHLFGHPADMDALRTLVRGRGIALIEDAAQAHGGLWKGAPLGSLGDFGCFSFYPTKNLGGMGDGGAILVKTKAHADRLRRLRDHGQSRRFHPVEPGFNARLDAVQALFLTHKLPLLTRDNARRAAIAAAILKHPDSAAQAKRLTPPTPQNPFKVSPLRPDARGTSAWHALVIKTPRRTALIRCLEDHGIGFQIYYPTALPDLPLLARFKGECSVARALARTCLALPLHPALGRAEIAALQAALFAPTAKKKAESRG